MKLTEILKMESIPSSTISDSMLPPILKEYDTYSNTLRDQLEFYKQEHVSLRAEVISLLEENKHLTSQLKAYFSHNFAQEKIGEASHHADDMIANLQRQILLVSQEKAVAMELYQTAVKEVEALEMEVEAYRNDRHLDAAVRNIDELKKEYSTAITLLEEKIDTLKSELSLERSRRESAENDLCLFRVERDRATNSLQEREKQLENLLEGQTSALNRLEEASAKLRGVTEERAAIALQRDEMEAALAQAAGRAEELGGREAAALARVEEALALVDAAVLERDAALQAREIAQEEMSKLQKHMEDLVEDAGKRVAEEGTRIKLQFNSQMEVLLRDMRNLQEELSLKNGQLEKTVNDLSRLEEQLHKERKERLSLPDPELMQRNVDNAYRELRRVEHEVAEVTRERDRLVVRLEQEDESHRVEMAGATEELRLLRSELQATRSQAEQSEAVGKTRVAIMEEQLVKLEQQVASLQTSNYLIVPRDQIHAQCEVQLEEYRLMISQLNELQKQGVRVAQELQSHLQAQVEAKRRWQNEVKKLNLRFEQRIDSLNSQLGGLKKVNKRLERELAAARMFPTMLNEMCPHIASGPGPP